KGHCALLFCKGQQYCVLVPTFWFLRFVQAVATTDDSSEIPEHTTVETPMDMYPVNKAHFESEKEAIHLILTGIGDEIYSTVDACQIAQETWEAIERLQQGAFTRRYTGSHHPKTYWESLPEDILGVITQRHIESHYPKIYWESLPEDKLGVITRIHIRSHYLMTYWKSLPEDILRVITRRYTGSHYPKTYWESLPEDILEVITRRHTSCI
nr:hypothetical protein [Tanacetum cinerariifolium]